MGTMFYCAYLLLPWLLRGHHAGPGDGLEELLDLGGAGDKLVLPQLEGEVLDERDEGDEEAPRVRPVHDQQLGVLVGVVAIAKSHV